MLPIKQSTTSAREPERNLKSNCLNIVPKTTCVKPSRSCPQVLLASIQPRDGGTMHRDSSKRDGEQCKDRAEGQANYSRVLRLTDWGSLCTSASSFSFFISVTSPTSGLGTAWSPRNALSCPSGPQSNRRDISARSKNVLGAQQLRIKHVERISRTTIEHLFFGKWAKMHRTHRVGLSGT